MNPEDPAIPKDAFHLPGVRGLPVILLGLVLLVACMLRFHELESRQPRISDEADYIMEAQWISSLTHAVWDSLALYREEKRSGNDLWKKEEQIKRIGDSIQGHAPYLARPGHVLLIALTMQLGMDPVLAGAWEGSVFGALTVFLLFLLASHLYGTRSGLIASFLLAVSAYHVWYSRTGLSEADTTFFLLLTVFLYALAAEKDQTRFFVLTGLSAGIGFVVHHRFLLFLGMIGLLEIFRFFRMRAKGATDRWLAQFLGLLGCACLPALLIESLYHIAFIAFQVMGRPLPCATYFSQLVVIFGYIRINNLLPYAHFFTWSNFLTYPYIFWYMDGPLFCALLAGGILTLVLRHRRVEGMLALFLLAPLLFYSCKNANARFACSTLPFAVLAITLFLESVLSWAQRRGRLLQRGAPVALVALLMIQAGIAVKRMNDHDRLAADWRSVMNHLQGTGNVKNISVYPHMSKLYLGDVVSALPPDSLQGLERLYEQGFRWFILAEFLDYYAERFDFPAMRKRLSSIRSLLDSRRVLREIPRMSEPAFVAPCEFCTSPLNILEINLNFQKSLAFVEKGRENGYDSIKVYDLKEFFSPEGEQGPGF